MKSKWNLTEEVRNENIDDHESDLKSSTCSNRADREYVAPLILELNNLTYV